MRNKIQAEAVQAIVDNNYNCLIVVACRVGKTKLLLDSIRGKEDKKIAVVAPFNSILDSWRAEILKWDLGFTPTLLNIRFSEELPMDLDLLIIDECHQISDNQYKVIKSRKPKRIVGATGTLGNKNKQKLRQELGLTVKYDYSIEQAIEHNIISDYEIFIKEVIF